jgi:hypothetical protein
LIALCVSQKEFAKFYLIKIAKNQIVLFVPSLNKSYREQKEALIRSYGEPRMRAGEQTAQHP